MSREQWSHLPPVRIVLQMSTKLRHAALPCMLLTRHDNTLPYVLRWLFNRFSELTETGDKTGSEVELGVDWNAGLGKTWPLKMS